MAEIKTRIILRNDSTGNWNSVKDTVVLLKGEVGIEFDPSASGDYRTRMKIGDGFSTWAELKYFGETTATATNVYQTEVAAGADHAAAIETVVGTATKNKGDIVIVKETITGDKQQYTAYVYTGTAWAAMDGNYSAENVYFKNDLTSTFTWGKYSPDESGSVVIPASGKNLKELLEGVLAEEKTPDTTQPKLTIGSTNIGAKEAGTKVQIAYTTTFDAGSYTYGPATGVTASDYKIKFNGETLTTETGTFAEVQVTDDTSMKITGTFDHTAGATPKTNLGNDYETGKIVAENDKAAVEKGTLTGYRNMFFGTMTTKPETMTSANIRALTTKVSKQNLTDKSIDIPVGAMRVIFAVPSDKSIDSVKDVNAMSTHIFSSFTSTTVSVEGANGYTAKTYNVYYLDYANANNKANKYLVTVK